MTDASITWLGHAALRIDTPGGMRVYVDPWLDGPTCPESEKRPDRVDVVAVTHAHDDHTGSAVELGRQFGAPLVAMVELAYWLEGQGYPNGGSGGMNKGGTQLVAGVSFTMTHAFHSSSTADGQYAGEPAGFVIGLEDDRRIYVAGDTAAFGDMALIARIYRPELAVIPIGDHYTMGPREAAVALELLGVSRCLPVHYGTFPVLTGTPARLRELAPGVEILEPRPGERVVL